MIESNSPAKIIWITGLPAAGKTTLAKSLIQSLKAKKFDVEHLDGDEIRKYFPDVGFDRIARDQHIRRVGHTASLLQQHNVWVVVSLVSPIRESRDFVRSISQQFVEVFLDTPLKECMKRDPKGLYRKAQDGTLSGLTGLHEEYERPLRAEITLDNSAISVEEATQRVFSLF